MLHYLTHERIQGVWVGFYFFRGGDWAGRRGSRERNKRRKGEDIWMKKEGTGDPGRKVVQGTVPIFF